MVTFPLKRHAYDREAGLVGSHVDACPINSSTVRLLDRLLERTVASKDLPAHQRTVRRGEEEAYVNLRNLGYVVVARNYRSPKQRGEIDLIGWKHDVLCFIEVKTRTTHDVKPAETAVDRDKQRELSGVAREYLRRLPVVPTWRFDGVSVYYDPWSGPSDMELFENAFRVS